MMITKQVIRLWWLGFHYLLLVVGIVTLLTNVVVIAAEDGLAMRKTHFGQPEQVHISFGNGPSQMWITWMTFEEKPYFSLYPMVQYGTVPFEYDQVTRGRANYFQNGNRTSFVHRVLLDNLEPNTTYYYRAGTEEYGWTEQYRFQTRPANQTTWRNVRLGVYGDLGLSNGQSIPFLLRRAHTQAYDAILHVGDIAYDLEDDNGEKGDRFMRKMEPVMANIPYQMVVGNHESWNNFTQYNHRFTMIDERTGVRNNHFYSFNIGPAHIVGFNSEFYYWYYDNPVGRTVANTRIQYEWLEADLREASKPENLAKHPWIITMGHRPMYCSTADGDDCVHNDSILRKGIPIVQAYGLEDLFYKYGVDIIFGAHEHTYERLFPVYNRKVYNGSALNPYVNPKAPIHLLVGSAGCPEKIDPFVQNPKPWSAKRITDYGITEFTIVNHTHIHVQQRSTDKNGIIVDDVWFVKEKHGPLAWI